MSIYCLLFTTLLLHLFALDPEAEKIRAWAHEKMKEFPEPDYHTSGEEMSEEELARFMEDANNRARKQEWTEEERGLVDLIKRAPKKEEFEGDEAQFHPEIVANPLKELGVASNTSIPEKNETILKTCVESGNFEREFLETLEIAWVSERQKVKRCLGHSTLEEIKGENDSKRKKKTEKRMSELRSAYEKNPDIQKGFSVWTEPHKYHCDIKTQFQHIDDSGACSHFQEIDVPALPVAKDKWTVDFPQEFTSFKQNPNCKVWVHVEKGPEEREIAGKKVFRDIWAKKWLFTCSPAESSPCEEFRKQKAVLVKKQCLQENGETGDCELWEKTYDLGKLYSAQQKLTYEKGKAPIWGLNGEFDPPPRDKQSGLPQVIGIMRSLTDMPLGEGPKIFDLTEKTPIFNGVVHQCNCHLVDELYDCCENVQALWPAHCDREEIELRTMRDEGRCHRIGSFHNKTLGIKTSKTKVFCCFPTKLLRVFNEQARKQMGIGWGTPKKPDCRGFSLEQMDGKIDGSTMDFSEAGDEIQIDHDAIEKEMAEHLRASLESSDLKQFFLGEPDAVP